MESRIRKRPGDDYIKRLEALERRQTEYERALDNKVNNVSLHFMEVIAAQREEIIRLKEQLVTEQKRREILRRNAIKQFDSE